MPPAHCEYWLSVCVCVCVCVCVRVCYPSAQTEELERLAGASDQVRVQRPRKCAPHAGRLPKDGTVSALPALGAASTPARH